jgi:hypothetical protein
MREARELSNIKELSKYVSFIVTLTLETIAFASSIVFFSTSFILSFGAAEEE